MCYFYYIMGRKEVGRRGVIALTIFALLKSICVALNARDNSEYHTKR